MQSEFELDMWPASLTLIFLLHRYFGGSLDLLSLEGWGK